MGYNLRWLMRAVLRGCIRRLFRALTRWLGNLLATRHRVLDCLGFTSASLEPHHRNEFRRVDSLSERALDGGEILSCQRTGATRSKRTMASIKRFGNGADLRAAGSAWTYTSSPLTSASLPRQISRLKLSELRPMRAQRM